MKLKKKIARMTDDKFTDLYMRMTNAELAKKLGCSKGAVIYHAKRLKITGIKKRGAQSRIFARTPRNMRGME